jgi:DNA gyrase subunit A
MFATSLGNIRRNDLSDFKKIQSNGKIAIRLDENDNLVAVKSCSQEDHILLATKNGKAIRFNVDSVRVFKSRTSDGVRGMKLSTDDRVISMTILRGIEANAQEREIYLSIPIEQRMLMQTSGVIDNIPDGIDSSKFETMIMKEEFILTISENGYGKRSSAYEYRITGRGGSGVVNMAINGKTGNVVSVMPVDTTDELMLITNNGKLIRCKLDTLRATGRSTSGVILFKTSNNESVVSSALISDSEDSADEIEEDLES